MVYWYHRIHLANWIKRKYTITPSLSCTASKVFRTPSSWQIEDKQQEVHKIRNAQSLRCRQNNSKQKEQNSIAAKENTSRTCTKASLTVEARKCQGEPWSSQYWRLTKSATAETKSYWLNVSWNSATTLPLSGVEAHECFQMCDKTTPAQAMVRGCNI